MLPDDSTPLVKHFLSILKSTKNFEQMCAEHGLQFSEIVKVVKHLVYWGLGRLIYPIQSGNVYILTPEIARIPEGVTEKFEKKFPTKNLMQ